MNDKKIMFHYTSLDKFKCILQHGTLRFKESTKSNDILDTTLIFEILKEYKGLKNCSDSVEAARQFMLQYYQEFGAKNQHVSLVACFANEGDSRMLWDAYTMNRPSNIPCKYSEKRFCYDSGIRYNGVCIGFNKQKLDKHIKSFEGRVCERAYLHPIMYGNDKAKEKLNYWFSEACAKVESLSKDPNQKQDLIAPIIIPGLTGRRYFEIKLRKSLVYPMKELIEKIDAFSPFFKHEFWSDENEIRASLCFHKNKVSEQVNQAADGMYYDMPIDMDCIEYVILGPELSSEECAELESHDEYKLDFRTIEKKASIGTNVIRSE